MVADVVVVEEADVGQVTAEKWGMVEMDQRVVRLEGKGHLLQNTREKQLELSNNFHSKKGSYMINNVSGITSKRWIAV